MLRASPPLPKPREAPPPMPAPAVARCGHSRRNGAEYRCTGSWLCCASWKCRADKSLRQSRSRLSRLNQHVLRGAAEPERTNDGSQIHPPTNPFSKKIENHAAAVALGYFLNNFIEIHRTLRMTPAMAAGVTNRLWEVSALVCVGSIRPGAGKSGVSAALNWGERRAAEPPQNSGGFETATPVDAGEHFHSTRGALMSAIVEVISSGQDALSVCLGSDYSLIEHLAKIASGSNWMRVRLAMFTAYFDASGDNSSRYVVAVCGFVASADAWIAWESEWLERLRISHLDALHMSELEKSKNQDLITDLSEIRLDRICLFRSAGCAGMGLRPLVRQYGEARLESACTRAVRFRLYRLANVRSILIIAPKFSGHCALPDWGRSERSMEQTYEPMYKNRI